MDIVEPPAAMLDWEGLVNDLKVKLRITKPVHFKETFGFSQSTVMALWTNNPVGVMPLLRCCKRAGIDPTKYLMER